MIECESHHVLLKHTWFRSSTLFFSEICSNLIFFCWRSNLISDIKYIHLFGSWQFLDKNVWLVFSCISDIENRFLSCWSTSWKSCYRCWWVNYLLWLWHDGGDKIFHPRTIAWTVLCCLWEGCQKGLFKRYPKQLQSDILIPDISYYVNIFIFFVVFT